MIPKIKLDTDDECVHEEFHASLINYMQVVMGIAQQMNNPVAERVWNNELRKLEDILDGVWALYWLTGRPYPEAPGARPCPGEDDTPPANDGIPTPAPDNGVKAQKEDVQTLILCPECGHGHNGYLTSRLSTNLPDTEAVAVEMQCRGCGKQLRATFGIWNIRFSHTHNLTCHCQAEIVPHPTLPFGRDDGDKPPAA